MALAFVDGQLMFEDARGRISIRVPWARLMDDGSMTRRGLAQVCRQGISWLSAPLFFAPLLGLSQWYNPYGRKCWFLSLGWSRTVTISCGVPIPFNQP
jgi:hypothetical protein